MKNRDSPDTYLGGRGGGGLGADLQQIDWARELPNLIKFEKNFYVEHDDTKAMTDGEVDAYRKDKQISIWGDGVPKPITSFRRATFPDYVMQVLNRKGFDTPSPIQAQVCRNMPVTPTHCCTGLAYCHAWSQLHLHCSNWFGQDAWLHPSSHRPHQQPAHVGAR